LTVAKLTRSPPEPMPSAIDRKRNSNSTIAGPGASAGPNAIPGEQTLPAGLAVRAEGLSKCYRIYNHPRDRLLQALWGRDRRGRPKQFYQEFWALQALSFELGRGQTLGVVGRNGSGKSTLLQLLCGTLAPTTGTVQLRGRVGALLELGSGFNPEFSGLENVFLNASLLGLSQAETEARLDQILGFADIGTFIHQPVKTYSSGMAVRLAFAVQAHVDPDVLVVDEALAVGDELFQKKCYAHLERLKEKGTSILLVTHSCPAIIQHCDQALLLHRGKARMLEEPAKVTITYQRLINASDADWDAALPGTGELNQQGSSAGHNALQSPTPGSGAEGAHTRSSGRDRHSQANSWFDPHLQPQSTEVYPAHGAQIIDAWIERARAGGGNGAAGEQVNVLPFGEDFVVCFRYSASTTLHQVSLACHIASHTGQRISGQSLPACVGSPGNPELLTLTAGAEWTVSYPFKGGLWPGLYFIGGGILTFAGPEQGANPGKSFVHRVVDFRALRILEQTPVNVIGSCALQNGNPSLTPWRPGERVPAGT
jgi:lipopolysaccharide transport system ATP-binding protein